MELKDYSEKELRDEILRRVKDRLKDVKPAFRCYRCGASGYFHGSFSQARFEWQAKSFEETHKDCLPILDGGMI